MRPAASLAAILLLSACGGTRPEPRAEDAGVQGSIDAGTDPGPGSSGDAGISLSAEIAFTETKFDLLAVGPDGAAYASNLLESGGDVWASGNGREWQRRGSMAGATFWTMTSLSDGTLLADVATASGHALARSIDRGATWTAVLSTGKYRALTPHSFAELDGAAYFLEYQVFTSASTPIRLWRSTDSGATWTVRQTFEGHRHGHGLAADPARHALWAFFGDTDAQSGTFRSADAGASWTAIVAGVQDGDIVDAVVLPDGSLLCGQDISYQPPRPAIARIALDGTVTHHITLPSASYSTHAVGAGGYVVGATYEVDNDISPLGWTRGSLWGSGDGEHWEKLLDVPQLDPTDDVRTDVYWELPSGELVVNVRNAFGFGPGGRGYMLLRTNRR